MSGQRIVNRFFDAVFTTQVFEGMTKTMKNLARVGDADLVAEITRKPVAEVAAAFAARVDLEIRKQITGLPFAHMLQKTAGDERRVQRNVAPGMDILELGAGAVPRLGQIRNAEHMTEALGNSDVADLQLGQFFEAGAGKKRQQR